MNLNAVLNIGTENRTFSQTNKIRITNLIGLFTTLVSGLYTLVYLTVLDNIVVAFINALFTLAYASTLAFNYYRAQRGSKIWFFSVLMVHLVVCTNLYVTTASGFHLYFFLVPTGVYLLFELKERTEKVVLSLIAIVLYFYCENTFNASPLIELSAQMNHMLYQSVIFINMIEVIIVMILFTHEIEINDEKLTRQARTDALTSIANRHQFFERGNEMFKASTQSNRPFSLMILDFDHFKGINDKYGHFVGDLCLVEISKIIKENCREGDLFARIGGEEFAIAFPETTIQEANAVAEKMRIAIEKHKIPVVGAPEFTCTASFGLTTMRSHHDSLKYLLIQADKALYLAKEHGRNRVHSFDTIGAMDLSVNA